MNYFLQLALLGNRVFASLPFAIEFDGQIDRVTNSLQVPVFMGTDSEVTRFANFDMSSRHITVLPNEATHGRSISLGPGRLVGSGEVGSMSLYPASTGIGVSLRRKIGANFASVFANTVGKMMMVPTDTRESVRVIVGPFEAYEYCVDPIVTIPATFTNPGDGDNAMVYVSISVMDSVTEEELSLPTEPELFRIDAYFDTDTVPRAVLNDLRGIFDHRFGLHLYAETNLEIAGACEHIIDRLPALKYSIMDQSGQYNLIDVILQPRDYIKVDVHTCPIQLQDNTLESDLPEPDTRNILGMNFLRQVAVLFDYRNNQFGFCEPN